MLLFNLIFYTAFAIAGMELNLYALSLPEKYCIVAKLFEFIGLGTTLLSIILFIAKG